MNESIYNQMTRFEKEVADLLKELGIRWAYEQPVFVWDENKRPRVWTPDFYLIHFGIYIEVCGSGVFNYNYRKNIYKKNGYDVIFLHMYKESNKWKSYLIKYLKGIINYRNNCLISINVNYIHELN
jgi:hypothetical protein